MDGIKATNKKKETAMNPVEVILTNYYCNPLPKALCRQSRESNEEEKIYKKNKSDDWNLKNKFIDTKFAISKHSTDELLGLVRELASIRADPWSESESLTARFEDMSLVDYSLVNKDSQSALKHNQFLNHLEDNEQIGVKKKYTRLTDSEKLDIVKEVKLRKRDKKDIAKDTGVSISTIRRVVDQLWTEGVSTPRWFNFWTYTKRITKSAQKVIKEFVTSKRYWITAGHIADHIKEKINQEVPNPTIRKYLKENLRFSYRKGTPKPCSVDIEKLKIGRIWYSYSLLRSIPERTLLVNIDEASFSGSVFNNRSWFPKGLSGEVFSIGYRNSISLILAVTSEGDYFGSTIRQTVNGEIYIQFLENLWGWLKNTWKSRYQSSILIHDNAPIHRAKKCLDFMRDDDFIHAFLPPYTPEYAPVELVFSQIKSGFKKSKQKSLINLRGDEGVQLIANEL